MGTGVGEAMLIGAAVGATAGGAGAAIQGGDPLKGALMGGALGGIGGGLGGAFGGAAGAAEGAGTAAATGGGAGGASGAAVGSLSPTVTSLAGSAPASTFGTFSPGVASAGIPGATSIGMGAPGAAFGITAPASGALGGGSGIIGSMPVGSALAGTGAGGAVAAPATNILGYTAGSPGYLSNTQLGMIGGGSLLGGLMQAERAKYGVPTVEPYESTFDSSKFTASRPAYAPESVYVPRYKDYTTAAEGGIMRLANGGQPSGPVERMSTMNQQPGMYPQGMIDKTFYATPVQRPASMEVVKSDYDTPVNPISGIGPQFAEGGIAELMKRMESARAQGLSPEMYQNIYGQGNAIEDMQKAMQGKELAKGGVSSLGGYSDGGRMLKGPGDGMSDSIPGVIGNKQPARLAEGEFVVPADVVSHLGNGSTDAGAKQLYSMMDKVRKARTGTKKQGKQINPNKYVPA